MLREDERFDETGGYGIALLDNHRVFEKPYATYGGNYARGRRKYSTGQHSIRVQLEALASGAEANTISVGIISAGVNAKDQYFNRTPSTYGWEMSTYEWEEKTTVVHNGVHVKVPKSKWAGAETGDVIELTIDCDQQTIGMKNETRKHGDSIKVDVKHCPLPWKFLVVFSLYPDRVRLL